MRASAQIVIRAIEKHERSCIDEMFRARRDAALLALARARTFAVAGERLTLGQIAAIMNADYGTTWEAANINTRIKEAKARAKTRDK